MNHFALLLLVVVGTSAAPASGRKTVLSMALDLLPDLQAVLASAPPVEGVDRSNVDGISRAFTVFIPIVRQVLQAQADQEKREVDPNTIDTLNRVQRLIPGVINLIGATSSGSPLGVDLEFALPDFTNQILGASEAGDAPPVPNDIVTDTGATYPTLPVPTLAAPQVPTYVAAQVLAQPGSMTYTGPSLPLPHSSPASEPSLVNLQAPAAVFPLQFDYDAAFNAAKERGTQQSAGVASDGTVRYALPGGGFFYSTGY